MNHYLKMAARRILHIVWTIFLYGFAATGLIFVVVFFAIKFHFTDEKGVVDSHTTDFQELANGLTNGNKGTLWAPESIGTIKTIDELIINLQNIKKEKSKILCDIQNLGTVYPKNAVTILREYKLGYNDVLAQKMLFAAGLELQDAGKKIPIGCDETTLSEDSVAATLDATKGDNLYPWINNEEWTTISAAITNDTPTINQAAQVADIDPRLITANLTVEQLRLFHSQRELFEKFFQPLTILGNATKTSLGVMGIKEATAKQIESHLKDTSSPYYLGPEHEHDLDFETSDPNTERYNRLTNEDDHYYSYLYGGLYLKQMMTQWEKAGFDISDRPEIVGTLFNVGFAQSNPNANPKVGGSSITIEDKKYSFGSLAFEFYYSGELSSEFSLQAK